MNTERKKAEHLHENIFLAALFAIGVAIFFGSIGSKTNLSEPLTPGAYGGGVSALLCIACLLRILWINFIYPAFVAPRRASGDGSAQGKVFRIKEARLVAIQAALMIVYAIGITYVGYFTSTYLYGLVSVLCLTDKRTPKAIASYAVGLAVFCVLLYLVFTVFMVMMPNTPLI